jgi:hypothetical protein
MAQWRNGATAGAKVYKSAEIKNNQLLGSFY